MQQSGTHTVPSTVLSARDKDSCILSFGTQVMIITKNRDFSEVKFGLMRKFPFLNSFLLSLTLCQNLC